MGKCNGCKGNDSFSEKMNAYNFFSKILLFLLLNVGFLVIIPFIIFLIPYVSYRLIFSKKQLNFNFNKKVKNE